MTVSQLEAHCMSPSGNTFVCCKSVNTCTVQLIQDHPVTRAFEVLNSLSNRGTVKANLQRLSSR